MNERQLQTVIEQLCRQLGLMYYHTHRSEHSQGGWPDLVIIAPGKGALFWELKRDGQEPTPAQRTFLAALASVGLEVGVRRPGDLIDGSIVQELQQLARRPVNPGAAGLVEETHKADVQDRLRRWRRRQPPAGRYARAAA